MKALYLILLLISVAPTWVQAQFSEKELKKMTWIEPFRAKKELKVNQKAFFEATTHGSVGIEVKVTLQNEQVLKLLGRRFFYNKKPFNGESGGDKGSTVWAFEAKKAGVATIRVTRLFRGEVKSTHDITIMVKEK